MTKPFDYHDTPLPLDYYQNKYGMSRTTMWRFRKAGLPAIGVGSKVFVRESDFVAFLEHLNGQTVSATSLKNREAA